jgi:uncharacterized protein YaaR (DUF327 family)
MKKLIVIVAVLVSGIVNAQIDNTSVVTQAVSVDGLFDKDTSFNVNHLYLQNQFLDVIRYNDTKKILSIVHETKFSVFTKSIEENDVTVQYQYLRTDSEIISVLSDIQNSLPSTRMITVTNVYKDIIDEFIVNTYTYTNTNSQSCKVIVYFCNGQINNINYTVSK